MPMKAATIRLMYFMMADLRFAMEMVWLLTGVQVQKSCFEMVDGGWWKVESGSSTDRQEARGLKYLNPRNLRQVNGWLHR